MAGASERFYTTKGDDGTTGLMYGGRVPKDSDLPEAYGAVDEAQAAIGVARAEAGADSELDGILLAVEHDLWTVMAELATAPANRHKLNAVVTEAMVTELGRVTDELATRFEMPTGFVVPGDTMVSGLLEVARTVVRRAERRAVTCHVDGSHVVAYLNRLSSLLWAAARWQDGGGRLTKEV